MRVAQLARFAKTSEWRVQQRIVAGSNPAGRRRWMRSGNQPRNVCTLKLRSSSRALVVVLSEPGQLRKQRRQPPFFISNNQSISSLSGSRPYPNLVLIRISSLSGPRQYPDILMFHSPPHSVQIEHSSQYYYQNYYTTFHSMNLMTCMFLFDVTLCYNIHMWIECHGGSTYGSAHRDDRKENAG